MAEREGFEPQEMGFGGRCNCCEESVGSQGFRSEVPNNVRDMKVGAGTNDENARSLSDRECRIIDSLRTQYKHNEIPDKLISLIALWEVLPTEIRDAINSMSSIYSPKNES